GGISADNGGEPKGESPRAARWAPPRAERNLDSQGASREASPSAHAVGGRTPAGYRAVGSGTRRTPGVQGAAREAPQSERPAARTTVPDRWRETVAPDTVGTNASHEYAVGGRTPAPKRSVIPRAERNPDSQGAAREAPPSAHAAGGRTPAGYRAVGSGTRRTPGVQGAARAAPPRAERNPDSQGAAREAPPSAHAVGGKTPAGYRAVGSGTRRTPAVQGAAREAPPRAERNPDAQGAAREAPPDTNAAAVRTTDGSRAA